MAEGKNLYETVIVTSAKLGEEGSAALVERFKALIAEHGTVQSVDDWGKRRFAYPIEKQTEGYYTLINFESGPEFTAELDRRYHITDGPLLFLPQRRGAPDGFHQCGGLAGYCGVYLQIFPEGPDDSHRRQYPDPEL